MEEQNNSQDTTNNARQPGQGAAPAQDTHTANAGDEKNTVMGALAYLGPLVLVSYITAKDDPFVKFHIKQGLVLFVGEVGIWFLGMLMWPLMPIVGIINIAFLVLIIIGIVNVVQGKEKELPLVGSLSKHFSF